MNILLINYEFPPLGGGAGNAAFWIARELAAMSHRIRVLTSAFKGLPWREKMHGFEVARIPVIRRKADRCTAGEMTTFLLSSCLAAPFLPKPDCVVAFFGIPCGPAAWVLRVLRRTPYLVSLRGGDVPGFQPYDLARIHRLTGPVIRFLWRRSAGVVANSEGLARLAKAGAPDVSVEVIPNGVDLGRFRPREGGVRSAGDLSLIFVGRLVYQKGVDLLLEALAAVPGRWRLLLVGDGPDRGQLQAQARTSGLAERVVFYGWASRDELPGLLAAGDLFVFPSRDEGMPNAVLEAMASGLPVVASRIAGNEELVTVDGPEKNGWLFESGSVEGLRAVLDAALAEPEALPRMGANSRAKAAAQYSWRRVARSYAALCEQAAAG